MPVAAQTFGRGRGSGSFGAQAPTQVTIAAFNLELMVQCNACHINSVVAEAAVALSNRLLYR